MLQVPFEPVHSDFPTDRKPRQTQHNDERFKANLESHLIAYRSRLTKEEDAEFRDTNLVKVKMKILQIQEQQGKEKKMMNLTRIDDFLGVMNEWEQIVSGFADSSCFVGFIWGPVKALLQATSSSTDAFDDLLEAYQKLGSRLRTLEKYRELFGESQDMRNCLDWMYCDIMDFHLGALRCFTGPTWKRTFRPYWKDFEIKFKGILQRLSYHMDLLAEHASVRQQSLDRITVLETLQKFHGLRETLLKDVEHRDRNERQRNYQDAQTWLAAPSSAYEHEQACEKRKYEDQSGAWLLQKPQITEWKDNEIPDSSILWVYGIPGAGKTVLASKLIEECEKMPQSKTSLFYCVQKDPAKNTCTSILKSLLNQALSHSREALLPLCHERQNQSPEVTLQSRKQAMTLLETCLLRVAQQGIISDQNKTHEKQYIVIDGLDECEPLEWQQLVEFFQRILRTLAADSTRLRILFLSQHTNQIEKALMGNPCVSITSEDNRGDIENYVKRRTKEIGTKFWLSDEESQRIVQETCLEAAGMFLYARLVMDNLRDQPTQRLFHDERARKFPAGLSEAYERILQRIRRDFSAEHSPERWQLITLLLGWLVCARRLLKWQEIQLAYCIDSDRDTIDFEGDKMRDHIRDYCGSLIEASPDEFVRFVHSTTSRYLVMTGFVNELLAEMSLTTKCVRYLSLPCFADALTPRERLHFSLLGHYIFQDYAVAKWSGHFIELLLKATAAKEEERYIPAINGSHGADQVLLNTAMLQLGDALRRFTEKYEKTFVETSEVAVKLGAWDEFASSDEKEDLYMDLCAITAHIQQHQRARHEVRNKVSILALATAFDTNRSFLEEPAHDDFKIKLSTAEQKTIKKLYGERRYKCSNLNCDEFFRGFADRKSRKKHVDKHDRPFRCDVLICAGSFGFTSAQDLRKHEERFHPSVGHDQEGTFEPLESLVPKSGTAAKWPCPHCPKRFTRGFHMRNHIRTHSNERPFSCNECGKSFTRDYDRKRHEKMVHTGR